MTIAPFGPRMFARVNLPKARKAWKACGQSLPALLADVLPTLSAWRRLANAPAIRGRIRNAEITIHAPGLDRRASNPKPNLLCLDCDIAFPSPTLAKAGDGAVHGDQILWQDHAVKTASAASRRGSERPKSAFAAVTTPSCSIIEGGCFAACSSVKLSKNATASGWRNSVPCVLPDMMPSAARARMRDARRSQVFRNRPRD